MSEFYTEVRKYGNNLLYRGVRDGMHIVSKVPFKPTMYVKTNKPTTSGWATLYGDPVEPKRFESINDAKRFMEENEDVHGREIHGFDDYQYQFIYKIDQTRISYLDIEVVDPRGRTAFPDVQQADVPIVLISLLDHHTKRNKIFGWKAYTKEQDDQFEFLMFKDEVEMLMAFINHWASAPPEIYTGWNTQPFDTPYLINRIMRVLGEDWVNKLSPFGIVREKMKKINNVETQTYEIYGVAELDYLALYKKFTYGAKENYSLGFISELELGKTKLEIESDSFYDSYTNHYSKFVKYNALDSLLVKEIDEKMGLIGLIMSISYLVKCNYVDVFSPVKTWEVFAFNHLHEKKIATPPKKHSEAAEFEGAWVKEPRPGMYGWMVSYDATSLYPTIIRQWNMSPETLVADHRENITVDDLVNVEQGLSKYAFDNDCTVSANGVFFRKDKKGFIPEMLENVMNGRSIAKKDMLKYEQELQYVNEEIKKRVENNNDK